MKPDSVVWQGTTSAIPLELKMRAVLARHRSTLSG
jgi:hypothetical protein